MPTIQPDAVVRGFSSRNGKVSFESLLWCIDNDPGGTIHGKMTVFTGRRNVTYRFISDNPYYVKTIRNSSTRSVHAAFNNVSLQQKTFTPIRGCRAYLTAVRRDNHSWVGSLLIISPKGREYLFTGVFHGEVLVKRNTLCQPLL